MSVVALLAFLVAVLMVGGAVIVAVVVLANRPKEPQP